MTWLVQELFDDVLLLQGQERAAELKLSVASVPQRYYFAKYHLDEANKLVEGVTSTLDEMTMFAWMLDASPYETNSINVVVFKAAAHLMACVQNLHLLGDLFGYAIHLALLDPILSARATIRTRSPYGSEVLARLSPESGLRDVYSQLLNGGEAEYIKALSNCAKHRSLINPRFTMDFTGESNPPNGLKFQAFRYGKMDYPTTWAIPLLKGEIRRSGQLIESVGQALNLEVRQALGAAPPQVTTLVRDRR